jgi:predicted RNase H-like HicB family nuclease
MGSEEHDTAASGGWVVKVRGYEVWLEREPESGEIIVTCPDLPRCSGRADSLDDALLKIEDLILTCTSQSTSLYKG